MNKKTQELNDFTDIFLQSKNKNLKNIKTSAANLENNYRDSC